MDKHLLAENPMRPHDGGLCIICTVQPVAIYEVIEGYGNNKGIFKHYEYKSKEFTLRAHHYFSTDIDTVEESDVYKFMDDAWFWFLAYMKKEDGETKY